jgi:hypothetical protein
MTGDMADETTDQTPETPAEQAAPPAAPVQEATPAAPEPTPEAPVEPAAPMAEARAAQATDAPAEAVAASLESAAEAAPTGDAPAPTADAPAGDAPAPTGAAPAASGDAPAPGDKPKRRRSRGGGGSKVAKAWGVKAANVDGVQTIDLTPSGEGVPVGGQQRRQGGGQQGGGKGGQRKPSGSRPPRPPREKGPLPFDELRDAARTIVEIHGKRTALKDAFGALAQKEREQLSEIVAADGDFRVRARAISAGSLSAGKIGKALAAQQIAIADVQDLWALTLSKEDAAERQSWIRNAKRRDEERAKKQAERRNSADRISKEDMAKARDGHVSAQVRMDPAILAAFGGGGAATTESPAEAPAVQDAPKKDAKKKKTPGSSVLDRLGY